MTKARTTNVWTCADEEDYLALRRAMRLVPSAATLTAWSYSGGKRRGVFYDADRACFVMSDDVRSRPATILHIAAVRASMEIAMVALSGGARVEQLLGTEATSSTTPKNRSMAESPTPEGDHLRQATPLYIAQTNHKAGMVSDEFLNLMELAVQRSSDKFEQVAEEEAFQRTIIETKHEKRAQLFEEYVKQGVAELTVDIRGLLTRLPGATNEGQAAENSEGTVGGSADESAREAPREAIDDEEAKKPPPVDTTVVSNRHVHKIFVRRCASKAELQAAVDKLAGQSTSISFALQKDTDDTALLPRPESRAATQSPSYDGDDSPKRQGRREGSNFVELNSKNVQMLLCKPYATCVARPLLRLVAEQPDAYASFNTTRTNKKGGHRAGTPTQASSVNVSRLLEDLRQQRRSTNSPAPHSTGGTRSATPLEDLRKAVEEFDHSRAASPADASRHSSLNRTRRTISVEDADAMVDRLYTRDVKSLTKKREEIDSYIDEGAALLTRHPKTGALSSELEESVARLCYEAVRRKAEKVAEIEARVMEAVPRARESTLNSDDADAARERLTNAEHKSEVLAELREKYHSDLKKYKKLSKEKFAASVQSTYMAAVEKRAASMAKLEAEYGDFRSKKRPALKISREQEKEIGDRLCKKS